MKRDSKRKRNVIVAVFVAVAAIVVMWGTAIYAKQITTITGLTGNDATVTDSEGNPVNINDITGNNWTKYSIDYNWSIPDNTDISEGDTATVTLPDGMEVDADTTGDLIDSNGQVVGMSHLKRDHRPEQLLSIINCMDNMGKREHYQ